ncbi:MAG: methylmalonyl Co-A mutase-associated GTPase MeaB [Anaerolineaceae bacterium]|nr:methylmalonyl Co-A mutase-associated GTPase MeaB [Anaerolineaceae bacterium]MBN2678568.1 methylmalonyl Co-A mutase-associated GTPase MeaB [Anaerolineaceae bacterium]
MTLKNNTEALRSGDRIALAKTISQIEDQTEEGRQVLSALFPYTGQAHMIGITGSPGTGKSTLTARLAREFRNPSVDIQPQRVGILAVDPTSPFSGGAVLGDRVRMRDLAGDEGVYIRSMASRGALGGLSAATDSVAALLDAVGYDVILIETVGAGQDDVEIVRLAHTTIVVAAPDQGDDIQAIKAGILEIADILVLNKADLPGVDRAERALCSALELAGTHRTFNDGSGHHREQAIELHDSRPGWRPPLIKTIALSGEGTVELHQSIAAHRQYLVDGKLWDAKNAARLTSMLEKQLREHLYQNWQNRVDQKAYKRALKSVLSYRVSPYQAAIDLLKQPE